MNNVLKKVLSLILLLILLLAIGWLLAANNLAFQSWYYPQQEKINRETFKQSAQLDYVKANENEKDMIASVILHRYANYDTNKLSADSYGFIQELKQRMSTKTQVHEEKK